MKDRRAPTLNEEVYTNRELFLVINSNQEANLIAHQSILDSLKEFHISTNLKLDELVAQTKKTNGSVTSLKLWRSWMTGVGAIIVAIVVPLVVYIFNHNMNVVEAKLDTHIGQGK